jgi:hypothetical protein
MSFSNMEMIHLYIYFKQENAKKIYVFSVAVAVFVLRKTQLAENYYSEECLFPVTCILEKTVSSDVSGTILLRLPSGNVKIFVSCIGFQPVDTLSEYSV